MLLEWLSEAEQTLRFRGALPDDTEALQSLIDTHKVIQPQREVTHATHQGEGGPPLKESSFLLGNFRCHMQRTRTRISPAYWFSKNERQMTGGFYDTLKITHLSLQK